MTTAPCIPKGIHSGALPIFEPRIFTNFHEFAKILPKNLHVPKIMIYFAAFKFQVGRKMVAQCGGIFYATNFDVRYKQHRVGKWKHPQGISYLKA